MRHKLLPLTFYSPEDPGGSAPEKKPERKDPNVIADKFGKDPIRLAVHVDDLERDAWGDREKIRQLKETVEELQKGKVPEGAKVLTKDEAEKWEEYRKLGTPSELLGLKTSNEEKDRRLAVRDRKDLLQGISSPENGRKLNADVLYDLDSRVPGLRYEKKMVKDEDGESEQWMVSRPAEGSLEAIAEEEVSSFFGKKFPMYRISLLQNSEGDEDDDDEDDDSSATEFPPQRAGSKVERKPAAGKSVLRSRYGHNLPKTKK